MDKTVSAIQTFASPWMDMINYGRDFNCPISVEFDDKVYELFTCIEHGLKGTGSNSYGFDHSDHSETKSLSYVQPKKCNDSNTKVHFFKEKCDCGSENFNYQNDSRWGIDSHAHFKYKIPRYHLWILEPESYHASCREFILKQFIIDSNNQVFNEILKTQLKKGKTANKNFLPYSCDFYCSNPTEVSRFKIKIDNVFGVMVSREPVEKIIYDNVVIKKMSKVLNSSFLNNKDSYLYEELAPFINIEDKKTTHGKNRGKTNRREQ